MGVCSTKIKAISPIKKTTGQKNPNLKTIFNKCIIKTVTKEELKMIELIFADLTRRYNKTAVNKEAFFQLFFLKVIKN